MPCTSLDPIDLWCETGGARGGHDSRLRPIGFRLPAAGFGALHPRPSQASLRKNRARFRLGFGTRRDSAARPVPIAACASEVDRLRSRQSTECLANGVFIEPLQNDVIGTGTSGIRFSPATCGTSATSPRAHGYLKCREGWSACAGRDPDKLLPEAACGSAFTTLATTRCPPLAMSG